MSTTASIFGSSNLFVGASTASTQKSGFNSSNMTFSFGNTATSSAPTSTPAAFQCGSGSAGSGASHSLVWRPRLRRSAQSRPRRSQKNLPRSSSTPFLRRAPSTRPNSCNCQQFGFRASLADDDDPAEMSVS